MPVGSHRQRRALAMTLTRDQVAGEQLCGKSPGVLMGSESNVNPWYAVIAKVVNSSWAIYTGVRSID